MLRIILFLSLVTVLASCGDSSSLSSSSTNLSKSVFNRNQPVQQQTPQAVKSAASGSAVATYNSVNGLLAIPQMQVAGDPSGATYSIDMTFQGGLLLVTSALPVGTMTQTTAMATYNPTTGVVSIPYATVVGDTSGTQYMLSLQQQAGTLYFSVANASISNSAPIANAGPDQTVSLGEVVTLKGNGTDADFDYRTYSWSFISKPAGSSAILSGGSAGRPINSAFDWPTFTPDAEGLYVLSLVVNDGKANSEVSTVRITVREETVMYSGREWQKYGSQNTMDYWTAYNYCSNLTAGGHDNWSVPTLTELFSLVVSSRSPAIDPIFSCFSSTYWTSDIVRYTISVRWRINFSHGTSTSYVSGPFDKTSSESNYVRCVRLK